MVWLVVRQYTVSQKTILM